MHALLCISDGSFGMRIYIFCISRDGAAACAFIMNYAKDDNTI